jgi:aldose 1-epimerase
VTGTPFDFGRRTALGARIDATDPQLAIGHGYDHNWVLDGPPGVLRRVARAYCRATGRALDVSTTEPGVQLYTGNAIPVGVPGKRGATYGPRSGFCLETQHFPDSPNKPQFPSTRVAPDRPYRSTTVFRFFVPGAEGELDAAW